LSFPSEQLISDLRRELLAAESRILELQDQIAAKQTEQSDAVALLGNAELLLENKIRYIVHLDQSLNDRICELEQECDRKSEEIERRGEAIRSLETRSETDRSERDVIISDLHSRLETANQQISEAHALAQDLDLKRAELCDKLESKSSELDDANASLAENQVAFETMASAKSDLQTELSQSRSHLEDATQQIAKLTQDIADKEEKLAETVTQLQDRQREIAGIKDSLLWKLGKPWRALFGPKS
jgi:chromosome segregation ATPase